MSQKRSGTIDVEVDGDTYTLRQYIGWFEIENSQLLSGLTLTIPAGELARLEEGQGIESLPKDTPIGVTLPGPEKTLARIKSRLVSWSCKPRINDLSIKNLPPTHTQAILAKIDELEAAESAEIGELQADQDFT